MNDRLKAKKWVSGRALAAAMLVLLIPATASARYGECTKVYARGCGHFRT